MGLRDLDRRQWLRAVSWGGLGALGGVGATLALLRRTGEAPVYLGDLGAVPSPSVRSFPDLGVALLRTDQGLAFLATRCTHLGCALRMVGSEWVCPCHGGRFSRDGAVLAGPPRAPLGWLEGAVSRAGRIYCYPSRPSPPRRYLVV
jgi:nitrite reductase/ring-hydroxylating ferredoxin subunit